MQTVVVRLYGPDWKVVDSAFGIHNLQSLLPETMHSQRED